MVMKKYYAKLYQLQLKKNLFCLYASFVVSHIVTEPPLQGY